MIPLDAIPVLQTERLTLRAPVLDDFEPYAAVLMSERARHIGGPTDRHLAWLDFGSETAGWILRGYGAFAMERREDGRFLGLMILHWEDGDPERELGWVLTEEAEGHGYGFEAARAARDHAYGPLGWTTVVSYIEPENTRSIRLAERLGATRDAAAQKPREAPDCLVYRHPAPEALS